MPTFHEALILLLVAPLVEELVFRAGLQEFLHRRGARLGANLVATGAFALAHALGRSWVLAAAVCLPSLCLGALYAAQRRVGPCVLAHAMFNAVWLFVLAPLLAGRVTLPISGGIA